MFLLDVDNTLFDNDRFKDDLDARIHALAPSSADRFWRIYEEVRRETGVVDYPGTARRLRAETEDPELVANLDRALAEPRFASYVYPRALDVIERLWSLGTVVILSDGDAVYQPMKIERSGLAVAVHGNVLVYPHKEPRLDAVMARFPADHYTQVDDKASLLAATKTRLGDRATTVHVRQGHYAADPPDGPPPDLSAERIGDLLNVAARELCP